MGFFTGSKTTKFTDPLTLSGFEWMRPAVSQELRGMQPRAAEMEEAIRMAAEPTKARFTDYLQGGQFRTPEEQQAIGYASKLLGTGAGQYMGGYSPELQQQAIRAAYQKEAPESVANILTQAGLGAPGIHHGLVREEAKTVAEDLYAKMQQQLAMENQWGAQFGSQAEQLAAGQRALGMQTLPQISSFADIMQRERFAQDYLQQLTQAPEQAYMQYISPMMQFNPATWALTQTEQRTPGWGEILGSLLSSLGSMGGGKG